MFDYTLYSIDESWTTELGVRFYELQFPFLIVSWPCGIIYLQGERVSLDATARIIDHICELSPEVTDLAIHVSHVREDFDS